MTSTQARLLTFGCSYSDEKYISATLKDPNLRDTLLCGGLRTGNYTEPFPFWPTLLADRLGMKLENHAQMGLGNDGIYSIFEDKILNADNVGLVVIMWSEVMRLSFEQVTKSGLFSTKNKWFKVKIGAGSKNDQLRKNQLEVEEVLSKQGLVDPVSLLRRSLRLFYSAQCMLEYKKIPYRMIMGMPPSKGEFQNKISKHLVSSPYTSIIKNFIGWPLFEPLEGFCCADMIEGEFINSTNIHPNARGQKLITDIILENI